MLSTTSIRLVINYPLFLSHFMNLGFSRRIFENLSYIKLKIRPEGAESFHSDRQTDEQRDTTKPTVAGRNFANTSKN